MNIRACVGTVCVLLSACNPQAGLADPDVVKVKQDICSRKNIKSVEERIEALGFEHSIAGRQLEAIKHGEGGGVIQSSIAVTVRFGASGEVEACDVRLVHTGP